MTTTRSDKPNYEVIRGAHAGTFKACCRLCRYATKDVTLVDAGVRIVTHIYKVHDVTPVVAR